MSAMSASPPMVLPLSLIAEHKVAGGKAGPPGGSAPQQAGAVPAPAPPAAVAPPTPPVPSQPQTNGMEPAQSPPTPAVAPSTGPPPISASPPPPPQASSNSVPPPAQGGEGGPVAPGSGTSTSGGSGEMEGSSAAVGDVPPADAQPSVPPTPATVPPGDQQVDQQRQAINVPIAPPHSAPPPPPPPAPVQPNPPQQPAGAPLACEAPATPQRAPAAPAPQPAPPPPVQPLPPAPVEASPPPPCAPAALPAPAPAAPAAPSAPPPVENSKPSRSHKRKLPPPENEGSKKTPKVDETSKGGDDGRKSKRTRLPTQPYQSPIPELNMIAKMNNTPKASEEKLIVFYRNEFLAVRNAEGGFYVCQAMQNIYRNAPGHRSKIKIRWFTQSPDDVFTPDFYDSTEFDCILTNLNLDRKEKDVYKLPAIEKQRTESILKRAIDAEKGIAQPSDTTLTEEHPDGLDLSLYRHEDQLKKRRSKKENSMKKKAKLTKAPVEVKKPTRTSARSSGANVSLDDNSSPKEKPKTVEKVKTSSRSSKKRKIVKKVEKVVAKKKETEVSNNKKETVENSGRKTAAVVASQPARKAADKTKSAVGAKTSGKVPAGAKQSTAPRQTRLPTPKQ